MRSKYRQTFTLDCCDKSIEMLPAYDGLYDRHLMNYFTRPSIQKHITKMKLVFINFIFDNRLINMELFYRKLEICVYQVLIIQIQKQ